MGNNNNLPILLRVDADCGNMITFLPFFCATCNGYINANKRVKSIGKQALATYEEIYNPRKVAAKYHDIYESC